MAARSWLDAVLLLPSARLFNQYSSTEALPSRVRGILDPANPDIVGRPDHDTCISIRDPETAEELRPGEVGEIWLSTPGVRPRHYADAAPDARSNTWVRMGDLGRVDQSGNLELVGRLKKVINRGGIKISPAHVERALESLPEVVEAAVFAVPHQILGEDVAAALVTVGSTTDVDVRWALREKLGQHEMPQKIVVLDELPRGPTGKVEKRELVSLLGALQDLVDDGRVSNEPEWVGMSQPTALQGFTTCSPATTRGSGPIRSGSRWEACREENVRHARAARRHSR